MEIVYDLCVIGAGMVGSAAARHASINNDIKICLIGPQEPKVPKQNLICFLSTIERRNAYLSIIYGSPYVSSKTTEQFIVFLGSVIYIYFKNL